ncbi:MAG: deoxyhypusine synthase family protein, partial [Synergistaceae bacterium]|nr:deoxyhypusine synthase family protein [Synergistaceae bacterium]
MLFGLSQLDNFRASLDERSQEGLASAVKRIVDAKKHGGRVMVVTGSGPNIHEGVTTLIAELIRAGIVDAVSTSSAVIAHEMAGSLDRVYRVDSDALGMDKDKMPRGDVFEFTCMTPDEIAALKREMPLDDELLQRGENLPHVNEIIKAAGNMAYPMGLRTERLAHEVLSLARMYGLPFETVAGWGCDEHTMFGAAAKKGVPVLVTSPQLVGGGAVGMSIGDSVPVSERSMRISRMLAECDV